MHYEYINNILDLKVLLLMLIMLYYICNLLWLYLFVNCYFCYYCYYYVKVNRYLNVCNLVFRVSQA